MAFHRRLCRSLVRRYGGMKPFILASSAMCGIPIVAPPSPERGGTTWPRQRGRRVVGLPGFPVARPRGVDVVSPSWAPSSIGWMSCLEITSPSWGVVRVSDGPALDMYDAYSFLPPCGGNSSAYSLYANRKEYSTRDIFCQYPPSGRAETQDYRAQCVNII